MPQSPKDRITRTAMSLAVLAAFSVLTFPVVLPYIFGSVSLVLAIISRGGSETMSRRARRAAVISSAALILNTALLAASAMYFVRMLHDPQMQKEFSETLFRMYGITLDEFLQQLGIQSSVL